MPFVMIAARAGGFKTMLETLLIIILSPIALCAAAVTVALGVGLVKGFVNIFKKK